MGKKPGTRCVTCLTSEGFGNSFKKKEWDDSATGGGGGSEKKINFLNFNSEGFSRTDRRPAE